MTNPFKSLAVATVAAAALSLPMAAQANPYKKCEDTGTAVAGGLVGGTLGAVIGEEIAGRGNNTEGAIAGAVVGGILGAAVGDSVSDCEKYVQGDRVHSTDYRTVRHDRHYNHRRHYNHKRHDNRRWDGRGHDRGFHYNARQHDRDLRRIDRRINNLRAERRDLKDRRRFERGRWIDRRLADISYELDYLKDERRRAKRAWDRSRQVRNRRNDYYYDRRW
ncbi:MAG: glycine zipper family protein [Pseudomonadota bacterium]